MGSGGAKGTRWRNWTSLGVPLSSFLDYENTLCRDRLWLYCQADLEFLSSGDPPASRPITRIRGRGQSDKCVSKVE